MAHITKRGLWFGIVVLVAALAIVIVLAARLHQSKSDNAKTQVLQQYVNVTGFDVYGGVLDANMISAVQDRLYQLVIQYGGSSTKDYTGAVRANSFSVSYSQYAGQSPPIQVPTYSFIVDIPDAKQSYKISYSGGPNYPYSILHIVCLGTNELIYGDFHCVDDEQ